MNATAKTEGLITKAQDNKIVLYTDKRGNVELRADVEKDTLWATQEQVARLFNTQRPAITKHFQNIFRTGELNEDSVCSILERTGTDRKIYAVKHYNLDAIIAVGYRVNSKKATQFRMWATGVLRQYVTKGYSLNNYKLEKTPENLKDLQQAIDFIESKSFGGDLKGKITVKLTKNLVPKGKL